MVVLPHVSSVVFPALLLALLRLFERVLPVESHCCLAGNRHVPDHLGADRPGRVPPRIDLGSLGHRLKPTGTSAQETVKPTFQVPRRQIEKAEPSKKERVAREPGKPK